MRHQIKEGRAIAVKSGQILHVGNGVTVIDRLQTAGPGQLTIPQEKIYELGNYQSVATVLDTPDLSFSGESLDVSCEIEALLTGLPLASTDVFDLALMRAIDITSPWKIGREATAPFDVTTSVGLPYLTPESMSYRFGLRDNARQTFGLRGDSIFYNPGPTLVQVANGTGTGGQSIALTSPAGLYVDSAGSRRVLSVMAGTKRLTPFTDYTITAGAGDYATGVSVTLVDPVPVDQKVQVMYFTDAAQEFPQTVHQDTTVKPAAVKGKDIDVYVGEGFDPADLEASATLRWSSVQAANVDWRVTLERDEEFGNPSAVAQDFDIPEVSGSVDIKPRDPQELMDKIRQSSGETNVERSIGAGNAVALPLNVVIKDPTTGAILKRLEVEDAKFTVPGYSARVQTKTTVTMNFSSDGGNLKVYKGDAAAA